MNEPNAFLEFTDADLKAALFRTLRTIAILAVLLASVVSIAIGWRSGMLLLVGALVSASGVREWQRLIELINARLDHAENPRPAMGVVTMFVLRLLLTGALLYVSLKCFHGSIFALVAGLALGVVGLSIEALRLVKT